VIFLIFALIVAVGSGAEGLARAEAAAATGLAAGAAGAAAAGAGKIDFTAATAEDITSISFLA
jgi:hypothetical protein